MKLSSRHPFKTRAMVCLVLATAPFVRLLASEPDGELESIGTQRQTLAISGLWGFFAVAQSNRWEAPKIYSQYWVDRLPRKPAERIQIEQAKRDFGLEMVKAIEGDAMRILDPADVAERVRQADRLLNFADWIGKAGGYGNLALKWRVENLACIPIGHLVADLGYPVERIEALLARLETEMGWVRMQSAILDEESPHRYDAKTKKELADQWHRHFRKAAFAFKNAKGRYPYNHVESKDLPREVSFYCEDEASARPYTLATKWNTKRHYIFCVMGYEDTITARVRNLLLFRRTIGRFPLKPSRPLGSFPDSEIQEGFYEAWKPYENRLGIQPGASGYTYQAIRDNAFMDYDTSEMRAAGNHR